LRIRTSSVLHIYRRQNIQIKLNYLDWDEWYWFTSVSRSEIVSTTTSEAETKDEVQARDMNERGWSTSKRVLHVPNRSRSPVHWAYHQESSSTPPAPSLYCCSRTSRTWKNLNKTLVCIYKKNRLNL
jgi:hypothetical protein